MSANTTSVEGVTIYKSSIITTNELTCDMDENGYRVSDGTNRGINCAMADNGHLILYMTSNGDDSLISKAMFDACIDLADRNIETTKEKLIQGAKRIIDAAKEVSAIYDNDSAKDDMDWFVTEAENAIASAGGADDDEDE